MGVALYHKHGISDGFPGFHLFIFTPMSESQPVTVDEYIDTLPADRKQIISEMRKQMKKHLPKGFKEVISYGMIGYVVPHSLYKPGYHCDPALPLPFISIASQKSHIALYHMGLYASPEDLAWFQREWVRHSSKKLDMGKSCIRFKKPEDVPLDLIGALAARMTPDQWIDIYETNLNTYSKSR
jgi:hypothetical protein